MSSFGLQSSRCTQCNAQRKKNARNLVVCIDSNNKKTNQNNTNVGKLFTKIDLETTHPEQHAFYCSAFGKRKELLHFVMDILNGVKRIFKFDVPAVAWDMEDIIKDAYGWLARTYQEGDQIYLFGFSQGAYQVRVLAGMIHEVGLLTSRTPAENLIATTYDHYTAIRFGKSKARRIAKEFKNKYCWKDLRVHFVGVWDSVSPVGTIRADDFLSTFQSSAPHACHFRHALALDECRAEFTPDYFHQMNTRTDDVKSKYIITFPDVEHVASPANERRESTAGDVGTDHPEGKRNETTEIKEVWFAGTHSDVGGMDIPGRTYQAGNVSLLWMRREAAASGLVLKPTDTVWLPDDLDFGTGYSWGQPRRVIPGQKVHASILHASMYKPQASLGEGFDILDMEADNQIWETGLFDVTAAHELVASLGGQQGVMPICLDRLLFMLRFKEGRQCVRNVPDWKDQLTKVIRDGDCAPLVRLVTIVAYYMASCDPEATMSSASPDVELPQEIFDDANRSFCAILAARNHRDGPRVVALLRCLTNHQILREQILTQDVLEALVKLFDAIISLRGENFRQAMDGLDCLLRCESTRATIIEKLRGGYPKSNVSRLYRILEINSPDSLTAALRVVMTLARIPAARPLFVAVKPRISELGRRRSARRGVGLIAIEILLAQYERNDKLNIRDAGVRKNLVSALVYLNPVRADRGQQVLRRVFGLDAEQLNQLQRNLIGELQGAVRTGNARMGNARKGNARKRTDATLTLLKLCENGIIRTHLLQINLMGDFVNQLRRKDTALFAAYALATCLKYSDMKDSMMQDDAQLTKNIVGMLRLDYFDDAVGQVEGFQIFGDLMQHVELREKIVTPSIIEILSTKLAKGESKETRTSLIYLDIFRSFDHNDPLSGKLVDESLKSLRKPEWKVQKVGVTILSALAQTKHGVAAIGPRICEIIEMLLPEGYLPARPITKGANPGSPTSLSENLTYPAATTTTTTTPSTHSGSRILANAPTTASRMMGPACTLRILVQHKVLRDHTRQTTQYGSLKQLLLSGTLVSETGASLWHRTSNRTDVITILDDIVKVVDDEPSEEGLVSIGDVVLPHIRLWDRFVMLLRESAVAVVIALPSLLGVLVLAVIAIIAFGLWPVLTVLGLVIVVIAAPLIFSCVRAFRCGYRFFKRRRSLHQDSQIELGEIDPVAHEGGAPGRQGNKGSEGGDNVGVQGDGKVERTCTTSTEFNNDGV